jgi:hypothetical protein
MTCSRVLSPLVLACMMLVSYSVNADSWQFKRGLHKSNTSFVDIRFVATVDARKNQLFPRMWIDMYDKRALIARFQGIHASQILSSDDGQAFVVLSSSGLAPLAAVVIARNGQILNLVGHDSAGIDYCEYSATLARSWYDQNDPDISFKFEGALLQSVSIRGCDGSRATLYGP